MHPDFAPIFLSLRQAKDCNTILNDIRTKLVSAQMPINDVSDCLTLKNYDSL